MSKIKWIGSAFVCMTFAFACGGGGGGSGVDPDLLLVDLTPDESQDVCEALADLPIDERTIDCGDGTTIDVEAPSQADINECADDLVAFGDDAPDCEATVGEFEDCFEDFALASDDELCDDQFLPASCELVFGDPDCFGV